MRAGLTKDLRKRLHRPDPRARVITQADVVANADRIQRKDHWAEADSVAGFRRLDDGRLTLTPSTTTPLSNAIGTTNATDLDRRGPITVGLIVWGGGEPRNFRLNAITARLDPDVSGGGKNVQTWKMQLFRLAKERDAIDGGNTIEQICAPVEVTAGASAADVQFTFPEGMEPQPKRFGPPDVSEASSPIFGSDPVTIVMIWAIDADGNAATNVAWVMDGGSPSKTTAGNFLTAYNLTANTGGIDEASPTRWVFAGASLTPRLEVVIQTFTAATITFTTNPLDLGAVPTGTVRFTFTDEEPGDTSVTYEVRDDAGSSWVPVTSGDTTADLSGVGKRQTYSIRATLDPGSPANKTPAAVSMGVEEVSVVDFDGLATVSVSGWQIDPVSKRGSVCEATIRALKDGNRDYRDKATALVADSASSKIAFRVYVGWKDSDGDVQGLHIDTFDLDDYTGEGAEMVFVAVGRNGRLRAALPVFDTTTNERKRLDFENRTLKAAWDEIITTHLGLDGRFVGPGVEDATTQATKYITDSEGIVELSALAELAGGGVISSQGRIKFARMHDEGGREVEHIFRSTDIQPMSVGPGLRSRVPQVYVPYDYDFEDTQEFRYELRAYSANALLEMPDWKIDRTEIDTETAKWIDTPELAKTVGTRLTSTMGTGAILWRFRSLYPMPHLEPGDVVAVETDQFAARDPNSARSLKGQLFALARVQRVGDVSGTDFTVWVQSYADISSSSGAGTRVGYVDPEIVRIYTKSQTETSITKGFQVNDETMEVWVYRNTAAQGTADPTPDPDTDPAVILPVSGGEAELAIDLPDRNHVTYGVAVPRSSLLLPGKEGEFEIHPLDPEPPVVQSDESETTSTGTVWLKFIDRGLALSSVHVRERTGSNGPSDWLTPDRSSGDASTVKGGTLGPGEYEHDVPLALRRFSFITVRYTVETDEVFYLEPFPFDRNQEASLWEVVADSGALTIRATGDTDTVSLGIERVDGGGTYTKKVDGRSHTFDLTAAGMTSSDRWTFRLHALAVPAAQATLGTTESDTQDVTVQGSSFAGSEPVWEGGTPDATAPSAGSADITITLDADSAPVGYVAKVYRRYDAGAGWTSWSNITADLSPSLTAPPTTSTDYTWTSESTASASTSDPLVRYEFRAEIENGSGVVVETETTSLAYNTGTTLLP